MNRKRKKSDDDMESIFPLLLAALSTNNPQIPLLKKCLKTLRASLRSQYSKTQSLPVSMLSLLPLLLSFNSEIARRAAEFVGAAALFSLEMNGQIARDAETVKCLVSLLVSSDKRVSVAACNAVLDLCTTSVGRQSLLCFSALHTLFFAFLQVVKPSTAVFLCSGDDANITSLKIVFKEDELPALLLDALIILVNRCGIAELERIPRELSERFLLVYKHMWTKVHNQMVLGNALASNESTQLHMTSVTLNDMAEGLFRLSAYTHQANVVLASENTIFGSSGTSFKDFLSNYWEVEPFMVGRLSRPVIEEINVLHSPRHSLDLNGSLSCSIPAMLKCLVSCPPISSDELDIVNFVNEARDKLGCPLIYEQDIRVLRAEAQTRREVHFSKILDQCIEMPHFLLMDDILKCEEAFREGYTIALRGMEFRFKSIASITSELASLFGLPSIGANLYLTPPNSQGLAAHYDDHCVFVCQILGTKRWRISTDPVVRLPRLYAPRRSLNSDNDGVSVSGYRNLLLKEGDILYIPRGYAHEACTDNIGTVGSIGLSLHLTLAVEIEPPFEWEGFVHVALFCWSQSQKQRNHASSGLLNILSINLLHLGIKSLGDSDPNFRKACLVASDYLSSDACGWLCVNQESTFRNLIDRIRAESKPSEVVQMVESAMQKGENPLQQMEWLQFLKNEEEQVGLDRDMLYMGSESLLSIYVQNKIEAKDAFVQVKNEFCSEVSYEESIKRYKRLLEKYKKVRTQYMNGMLSLHSF